ncbi:MAG: flagellar basal body rod protein FlgC [Firmicutes bacterium]|nr:flagellar basal body rod protein FlgC [Bacillota bacterium]
MTSLEVSGSALTANRLWLDLIAGNVANMTTTRTPEGGPYRRRVPVFAVRLKEARFGAVLRREEAGVAVTAVLADPSPPRLVFDPSHPDADPRGYVAYPNINIVNEMVDMMAAARAYEASATVLEAAKGMALRALEIGRG